MESRFYQAFKRFASCFILIGFAVNTFLPMNVSAEGDKSDLIISESNNQTESFRNINGYDEYIYLHKQSKRPPAEIIIPADGFITTDMRAEIKDSFEGGNGKSVSTEESGYMEWEFEVSQEGLYNIGLKYYPIKGKDAAIERELMIDGQYPFSEARNLTFSRVWKDNEPGVLIDDYGNEAYAGQSECPQWIEVPLEDTYGFYNEPFLFYFTKGNHKIRLNSVKEPMLIESIRLYQEKEVSAYEEVKKLYQEKGYKATTGIKRVLQAEKTYRKSDVTLYPHFDRTSPATEPVCTGKIRLNVIGWDQPGQWVEWKVDVPESGLYKLALRARQNFEDGLFANRKLLIDGKVPFKEAQNIKFNYDTNWQMITVGDKKDPYYIYMEKGTHTLKLQTSLGEMADILVKLDKSLYKLNEAYRRILMITGPAPDLYRDYHLDKLLPDVIKVLAEQAVVIDEASQVMKRQTGASGSNVVLLNKLALQLEEMSSKPETIQKRFDSFKSNIGALAAWVLQRREQPLEIDSIILASPDMKLPKAEKGFFSRVLHEIKTFVSSFVVNYNQMNSKKAGKKITVWLGSGILAGRDQAEILKKLVDDSFTPKNGINVDLHLVTQAAGSQNSLLPATLCGQGPDVALQVYGGDPINYAMRNAVVNLKQFPDFQEVSKRFNPSAFVPVSFRDGVYALPETESFLMMFYRKDILEEIGFQTPQTWDDVFTILPELQRRHMNFAIPVSAQGAMTGNASAGMHAYTTLLYQNGGELYEKGGVSSALDNEMAINMFKKWTGMYINYKLPLTYDFANRFRTGEIPVGIADYGMYNMLSVFAPEIRGLWEFAPVPGMKKADGTIDHSATSSVGGCVMMSTAGDKESAWEFMKWWTSAETQARFGKELESIMGPAARYATANIEAMEQIPWPSKDYKNLMAQRKWVKGVPEVPGGYYTPRYLDFAFRNVVYNGDSQREALLDCVRIINDEIRVKRKEFGLSH